MADLNKKFIDRMFRRVDNVVWDLMTGRVGLQTRDGINTIELGELTEDKTSAPDAEVSVNLFEDFGIVIPAFAQSVPVDSIAVGDLIYGATGPLGWVVKKNEKSFRLMKPDGTRSDWSPPKVQMLGFESGAMDLRNLINMFPGGAGDLGAFQGSLMPLLAFGGLDGDSELGDMLPLMLMSQSAGGAGGFGGGNMLQTLMLMKLMKGSGGGLGRRPGRNGFFD